MTEYEQLSAKNSQKALEIIETLRLKPIWRAANAEINLVGSLQIGVMAKHRDIDFHIYTQELNVQKSFAAIAEICAHPQIKKCDFTNLSATEEACFEWHLWYEDENQDLWQIDLIQIKKGTTFDGYFENVATTIKQTMTQEQRRTILKLKFTTPDDIKISGIEYYKAVIQDNISDLPSLLEWRKKNNFEGIIEW